MPAIHLEHEMQQDKTSGTDLSSFVEALWQTGSPVKSSGGQADDKVPTLDLNPQALRGALKPSVSGTTSPASPT
jgi:hypothetical protein